MVQLCFACKERNPCFVFPANRRKDMFEWMNILGLEDVPGKNAKLCNRHFSPRDIFYDGKMSLLEGAKPIAQVIILS